MAFNYVCGVISDQLNRHLIVEQLPHLSDGVLADSRRLKLSSSISIECWVHHDETPLESLTNEIHDILKIPLDTVCKNLNVDDKSIVYLNTLRGQQSLHLYKLSFNKSLRLRTIKHRRTYFLSYDQIIKSIANKSLVPSLYSSEILHELPTLGKRTT